MVARGRVTSGGRSFEPTATRFPWLVSATAMLFVSVRGDLRRSLKGFFVSIWISFTKQDATQFSGEPYGSRPLIISFGVDPDGG